MAARQNKQRSRMTARSAVLVCAALLIALILTITIPVAGAPGNNSRPPTTQWTSPLEGSPGVAAATIILGGVALGLLVVMLMGAMEEREQHERWTTLIEDANAKALETGNFSDTWVKAAAGQKRDELLNNAATIEREEAQRQVYAKERETEFREIAAYAASNLDLDATKVIDMLRKADELPYRLLQAAKAMKVETS